MRNVLITGASGGIGQALSRAFAKAGYGVALHYHRGEAAAERLARELNTSFGIAAVPIHADLRRSEDIAAMVETAQRELGFISTLVNNAGTAQQKLFTDITEEEWDRMFAVNVKGAFHMTQAALPGMISRRSGSVVNISSMWGQVGASCEVHYSASKAALIGMTQALAKEVGPSGVRVNCIAPGVIQTDMNAHLDEETMAALSEETPLMRIGDPDEIARTALFLSGDGASFITGQVLGVNGGFII